MARRSRAAWASLIGEWRKSGLTAEAFAARRRIKVGTLKWWVYELGRRERSAPKPLDFIEVAREVVTGNERFEVHLGSGRWISVATGFDADALGRLIAVVEGQR